MRVLVTFPGRVGDILWALPSIRALSRRLGEPVDLLICGEFGNLIPLLQRQPYLGQVVALPPWGMAMGWQPPPVGITGGPYDQVIHLGYRRWPELPLPFETLHTLNQWSLIAGSKWTRIGQLTYEDLVLTEPWITSPSKSPWRSAFVCGFSECHFELKFGLYELLTQYCHAPVDEEDPYHVSRNPYPWEEWTNPVSICMGTRWEQEGGHKGATWEEGADLLARTGGFLGDCSGWHVLAVAMGVPVVLVEPMEARHNPIFYPLGWDGPQVTIVKGLDGKPTVDARHTAETLRRVLGGV
jgi:hypothetical protein